MCQGITEQKVHVVDSATDFKQLVRHLGEMGIRLPTWRQQRPSLLVEKAEYVDAGNPQQGTLMLRYALHGI